MGLKDVLYYIHYTQLADIPAERPPSPEDRTFRRELPRLLAEGGEGKCALIKGDEVVGIFPNWEEAYKAGCERYLMEPFLAQPIREWEPVIRLNRRR